MKGLSNGRDVEVLHFLVVQGRMMLKNADVKIWQRFAAAVCSGNTSHCRKETSNSNAWTTAWKQIWSCNKRTFRYSGL